MPKENTQFKGKGLGVKHKQKPVSVMLPSKVDSIVRSLPNRSEFIRQSVIEKLIREGILPSNDY